VVSVKKRTCKHTVFKVSIVKACRLDTFQITDGDDDAMLLNVEQAM
jgi:hypothetical protein